MGQIILQRCIDLVGKIHENKITFNTYSLNIRLLRDLFPELFDNFTGGNVENSKVSTLHS
jgi:hypothetical protein